MALFLRRRLQGSIPLQVSEQLLGKRLSKNSWVDYSSRRCENRSTNNTRRLNRARAAHTSPCIDCHRSRGAHRPKMHSSPRCDARGKIFRRLAWPLPNGCRRRNNMRWSTHSGRRFDRRRIGSRRELCCYPRCATWSNGRGHAGANHRIPQTHTDIAIPAKVDKALELMTRQPNHGTTSAGREPEKPGRPTFSPNRTCHSCLGIGPTP